ncbi:type I polyketide synthase [Chitinophaga rhizophila]|uniref:Acyltransferase domain-containing protein n=1 Tax=Chitinophaga rhizophila TaxID=2866212 RepID=A0ABS7GIX2_9BACT|nr:type I polyketide synthase [Chitinophaga rhizophila]MBW8687180.1 acyltransferase domain-containing protein [Chitinophaga rhizophila]
MKKDIAIIGIAGKFPGSENIRQFWKNLVDEKELIHFFTDEELKEKGFGTKEIAQANYVKAASFIEGTDTFDYPFFKYTAEEAHVMNPQTRMMHQIVWEALEDAGCNVESYDRKIGIFLGANKDLNWSFYASLTSTENLDEMMKNKLLNPNYMASLISYKLNFRGPCYFLDTACSTSLSTVHLACRSLLLNECGTAVAGGIRLLSEEEAGYVYQEGSIMSKDGHNRTFDSAATGTIGSDGAGVVVLKKLEEAIRDNDQIYAVIKGSALNNDGSAKAGYTMPGVEGQAECIRLAHKIAGITPQDVTYVETHGTGTRIGDPIEIEALNRAFNGDTTHQCAIGAIKSNMGHADEAAGVAGLIKTAMAVKHAVIPASLHYKDPNPTIRFADGPFYVNHTSTPWQRKNGGMLTAGVSSFGIGGTNVHMVVQEAPAIEKQPVHVRHKLIRYSAAGEAALDRYEARLTDFLQQEVQLTDLAYTLQTGRKTADYARFIVAADQQELLQTLKAGKIKTHLVKPKRHIAFMFSGQGSQYVNMGKQLYEQYAVFEKVLDEGFARLYELKGVNYKAVLFSDQPGRQINDTYYTQPILFLFEYALARLLMSMDIKPDYMIGHSLGEYVAATISGVFSLEDALRMVSKRAELMAGVPEGDMISVGTALESVPAGIMEEVALAAVNGPDAFVLSGTKAAIAVVKDKLKAAGIVFTELKTSHAFHSPMMEEITADFVRELEKVSLQPPVIPFISNLTAAFITPEQATSVQYWVDHLLGTVQFKAGIERLMQQQHTLFIEVGPGRTLAAFFHKCQRPQADNAVVTTVRHPGEVTDDNVFFINFLGQLWVNGFDINWSAYYGERMPSKVQAPTYAFEPYKVPAKAKINRAFFEKVTNTGRRLSGSYYIPSWKQSPAIAPVVSTAHQCLILHDGGALCDALADFIHQREGQVTVLRQGDVADLAAYDTIVYAWNDPVMDVVTQVRDLEDVRVIYLNKTSYSINGTPTDTSVTPHLPILLQVLTQENIGISAAVVNVDATRFTIGDIRHLYHEIYRHERYTQITLNAGKRWVANYEPLPVREEKPVIIRQGGTYLLTGMPDEVVQVFATHLVNDYAARVILFSPVSSRKELPGVTIVPVDIADEAACRREIERLGTINGVIHTAKHTDAADTVFVSDLTTEILEKHCAVRVRGLANIDKMLEGKDVDFITVISSLSSFAGGISYGAYAAAAALMDYTALHTARTETRWTVINLDRVHAEAQWIHEQELIDIFYTSFLYEDVPQLIVTRRDPDQLEVREETTKKTLIAMDRNTLNVNFKAPVNETEEKVVGWFEELFGVTGIGTADDFFELGGDSLKAVVLVNRIKKEQGVTISIAELFSNKTAYDLASLVSEKKWLSEAKNQVNELII